MKISSLPVKLSKNISFDLASPKIAADGFRCWIGGESGSGKSTVAALIAGQVILAGGQVLVLDAHGEFAPLAHLSNVKLIGYGKQTESLNANQLDTYLRYIELNHSMLINLQEWTDINPEALNRFVQPFLVGLYRLRRQHPRFTLLLIEEAHQFMPQTKYEGDMQKVRIGIGIATGGRKYGINSIYCTQRQALVDKSVLAACNVRIFLRTSEVLDWDAVKRYIPKELGITYDEPGKGIRYFQSGEAIVLSRWHGDSRERLNLPPIMPSVTPLQLS